MHKRILYITYDGLTDPLGQSQILPYLAGLSRSGYQFTILSFEKIERMKAQRHLVDEIVRESGIEWVPLSFTRNPPVISKFYDAVRMQRNAFSLHRENKFDLIHCRSYIAADIGLKLKHRTGVKFLFDMRGFWADEKRDGGAWKEGHPVFSRVYKYYKKKEAQYLKFADHIISLTEAGRREMSQWPAYNAIVPVSVIPCCADMDLFSLNDSEQRAAARNLLGIASGRFVLSYLGSVGAWYMLDEMLKFFVALKRKYPDALFLFITHSDPLMIRKKANEHGLKEGDLLIREARRKEVPGMIKASDINISFIKPVYSKISSSPTKLGEVLSMGIPVIVNAGVGDVEEIVRVTGSGIAVKGFDDATLKETVEKIPELLLRDGKRIRELSASIFDLQKGIARYEQVYRELFADPV